MRKLLCLALIFISTYGFGQSGQSATLHTLDNKILKMGMVQEMTANWAFKRGDNPDFARLQYNDSAWEILKNTIFYTDQAKQKQLAGSIGWFRTGIIADSTFLHQPIVFYLKGVGAAEIYIDGKKKLSVGSFDTAGKHQYVNLVAFPLYLSFDKVGKHLIAIRYENKDYLKYNDDFWGIQPQLANPMEYRLQTQFGNEARDFALWGLAILFFTLAVVHLLLFLFYKKEILNLHFALFNGALALAFYLIFRSFLFSAQPFGHFAAFEYLILASICIACFSLTSFICRLFLNSNTPAHIALSLCALLLLDQLFVSDYEIISNLLFCCLIVGTALFTVISIVIALFKKKPGSAILGIGVLFSIISFLTIFAAIIMQGGVFISMDNAFGKVILALIIISLFTIPLSISAFLAWRFADTNKHLSRQIVAVEKLSNEKRQILEQQNEQLEQQVEARTRELQLEKQKSDDLLLNILPEEVAEELKTNGKSEAQQYDEVSVLFTDFVHFTQTSEQLGVEKILEELNINFTAFDKIMEQHGLEKIKTIGDAYLAVGGLPAKNKNHAQNTVAAALDIIEFVAKRKKEVPYGLDIRIGINSGSLIAGIIGLKKFAFDIWGDTVNTAARMEQNSEAGRINISENTYRLIKDRFVCTARGEINAKGKGMMTMYFVEGRRKAGTIDEQETVGPFENKKSI